MADNVQLLQEVFNAFNRGGVEAALPYFAEDVEWHAPPEWLEQSVYLGHDGLRRLAGDWGANFDEYRLDLESATDVGGGRLLVLIYQRGSIKGEGREVEQQIGYDWQLRDGKTARVKVYFSWAAAEREVCG